MLGGRFFDNIWNPYSVAGYAYPHPRPRYYRPRANQYQVPEDRSNEQPLNKKTVKIIPVSDGGAPEMKPVARSEDAAATEIQSFYRGYVVRKTQPLQHLKLINKVKEELESLKIKSQGVEQKMKLHSDPKERLRWTEGVMALLLRLDSLQGVQPEVRLIRKAVTKELLGFQETIDSMSSIYSAESNDVISHETIAGSSAAAPAPEVVEEMEIEDNISRPGVEDSAASENDSDGLGVKSNGDFTSEKLVPPHAPLASNDHILDSVAHRDENGILVSETMGEVGGPSASETLNLEDPMDAKNTEQLSMMSTSHCMKVAGEIEPASSQSSPPPEIRNQEAEMDMSQSGMNGALLEAEETTGLDGRIIPARISTQSMALEPQCEQDDKQDNMNALSNRSLLLQVLEENRKLKDVLGKVLERDKQESDVIHNLTHRIAQLEEHQPPSKLLHREDRKRGCPVHSMERSRRRLEKGRRNRRHRGYVDSEDWPSVESDDYF